MFTQVLFLSVVEGNFGLYRGYLFLIALNFSVTKE